MVLLKTIMYQCDFNAMYAQIACLILLQAIYKT